MSSSQHPGALVQTARRAAIGVIATLALAALLRLLVTPNALEVAEVDALIGSVQVADHITRDGDESLATRLTEGFSTQHERGTDMRLRALKPSSLAVAEPAWPRWVGAIGIMLGPAGETTTNLERASNGAALALALALVLLLMMRRDQGTLVTAATGLFVLLSGGALDAAGGAGYGAGAALAMAIFLLGGQRVTSGRGAWLAGLGLGLATATHPGASVLLIVLFVVFAISRRASDSLDELSTAERARLDRLGMITALPADINRDRGLLDLPAAPISLFLSPLIAVAVVIACFPSMWADIGSRFGLWFVDGFSTTAAPHTIAGIALDPTHARGASGWMALAQWIAWTTPPVVFLWAVGVARAVGRSRAGEWLPIVTTLGLLAVAVIDGGLFGARRSLLPLLWLPVAWTAASGLKVVIDYAKSVAGWPAAVVTVLMLLVWPVAGAVVGAAPGAGRFGAELRYPAPLSTLTELAAQAPGASVRFDPDSHAWRSTIEPLLEEAEVELMWSDKAPAWRFVAVRAVGPADQPLVPGVVRVDGVAMRLVGPAGKLTDR